MNRVLLRFAIDVLWALLALATMTAAVIFLVDGVEQLHHVWAGRLEWADWTSLVLARLPQRVWSSTPVLTALATAIVTTHWRWSGRWVALQSMGMAPSRVAWGAWAGALVALGGLWTAQQAAAPWCATALAGGDSWLDLGQGRYVYAEQMQQDRVIGIRAAWLGPEGLKAAGIAKEARYVDGHWKVDGFAYGWDSSGAHQVAFDWPEPQAWRERTMAASPLAPWPIHWRSPPSAARTTWLVAPLVTVLGSSLIAVLTLLLLALNPRWGGLVALVLATAWTLTQAGALSASIAGNWPIVAAVTIPLAALIVPCTFLLPAANATQQ